jgi:hypothetical protein
MAYGMKPPIHITVPIPRLLIQFLTTIKYARVAGGWLLKGSLGAVQR